MLTIEGRAEVARTLAKMQSLFSSSSSWICGEDATDSAGRVVGPTSPRAVCFCLMGAVSASSRDEVAQQLTVSALFDVLSEEEGWHPVEPREKISHLREWNDSIGSHQAVINLLEKSLQLVEVV